jgi:hypothetical protein
MVGSAGSSRRRAVLRLARTVHYRYRDCYHTTTTRLITRCTDFRHPCTLTLKSNSTMKSAMAADVLSRDVAVQFQSRYMCCAFDSSPCTVSATTG